jgi:phosphoenolpyruvate---glycerone phosphotransferase subunit DhaK
MDYGVSRSSLLSIQTMKRVINDPNEVAAETVEGFSLAHAPYVRQLEGLLAVVRRDAPQPDQVAIVTGGGSGHEPMFLGYVGRGMAHGSVAGNVFTSPPPSPIYATARAVHSGCGILFVYGNYSGDILNFGEATEMLREDGIEVATVRVADDVASASLDRRSERRGIAGDLFVIKVAGARAAEHGSLAQVAAAAENANDATRSMGVALSSCTIPAAGRPIFDIGPDEIELGLGLHGEPGVEKTKMMPADAIARYLLDRILMDLEAKQGQEVAVLINGLGNTPLSELYIVNRMAHRLIRESGLVPVRTYIGNYATSLDMAGFSFSVMRLDSELKRLLFAPSDSPALVQV